MCGGGFFWSVHRMFFRNDYHLPYVHHTLMCHAAFAASCRLNADTKRLLLELAEAEVPPRAAILLPARSARSQQQPLLHPHLTYESIGKIQLVQVRSTGIPACWATNMTEDEVGKEAVFERWQLGRSRWGFVWGEEEVGMNGMMLRGRVEMDELCATMNNR